MCLPVNKNIQLKVADITGSFIVLPNKKFRGRQLSQAKQCCLWPMHFCLVLNGCNMVSTAPIAYEMTGRKKWERKLSLNILLSSGLKILLEASKESAAEGLTDQTWSTWPGYLQGEWEREYLALLSSIIGYRPFQKVKERERNRFLVDNQKCVPFHILGECSSV